MITREEILMGRQRDYPLSLELERNLDDLHAALNAFRAIYGKPMLVTSGYRPGHYNDYAGGSKSSAHLVCLACDFADVSGELDAFCMENQDILEACGLYLEHPDATPGWCHLDMKERKNRVFRP